MKYKYYDDRIKRMIFSEFTRVVDNSNARWNQLGAVKETDERLKELQHIYRTLFNQELYASVNEVFRLSKEGKRGQNDSRRNKI